MNVRPMPFGAELSAEGVRFSLWAPDARSISLVIDGGAPIEASRDASGVARVDAPGVKAGARYEWIIDGAQAIPDPASRYQPDGVFKPSMVMDPNAYRWSDQAWRGRPWQEAVIYEAHVGTATAKGTFASLIERLDDLADLGVTMIELMPVAECPGSRNWGYDGVLPFAPNCAYGAPDDLKRLVDAAHARGLMMMLDVVYNHFGPSGNFLPLYAKSFFTERHITPWGAAVDFDATHRPAVREFIIGNACYWIDEFHFDGLRLDAVHAIQDESDQHVLAELAQRVRAAAPDREIHLVLENERNSAAWLERDAARRPKIYTAQWNDDIHHCWHVLLTGENEAYYEDFAQSPLTMLGRCLAEGFAYQGEPSPHAKGAPRGESSGHLPPEAFISFLQNHDQIGNRAFGERLSALSEPHKLALANAVFLLGPQIPMLFMGEEWAASTPFQFFVDFSDDPDLSKAVRDGRRREFQHFAAFSDDARAATIPDPTEAGTFEASTLRWDERASGPHAERLAETRALIALRRRRVEPLLKSGFLGADYRMIDPGGLDVEWRFNAGVMRLWLQVDGGAREATRVGDVIWTNAGEGDGATIRLTPWTGAISMETQRGE